MNTTKQALSYRELQSELSKYKTQGYTNIKLNLCYAILLAEYEKVQQALAIKSDHFFNVVKAVDAPEITTTEFLNWETLSQVKKQKLVNALSFHLTAYGYPILADSIISVQYRPQSDLWQIKYLSKDNDIIKWETMYDSELVNALTQTQDIPVFEPMEELLDTISALREEFAGIKVILSGNKAIVNFRALALTFLARDNKLIFYTRAWDCGNSWVQDNVDQIYRTHEQVQRLKAQLRSDFWFDLEVLEVA